MKSNTNKFKEKGSIPVFTVKQIYSGEKPILFVSHEINGAWHFFSGDKINPEDVMFVTLAEIVEKNTGISELFDLPKGWQASRVTNIDEWLRIQVG